MAEANMQTQFNSSLEDNLKKALTLAIEPMVIQGKPNILELEDGWTIITEDGSMAAHYENTILITEKEPEILTML